MEEKACCFFGHRTIDETEALKDRLFKEVEQMILKKDVKIFLFGSKSQFDSLCLSVVTKLKEKYPFIKRIYIRAEFADIGDDYQDYLLQFYEETYYPEAIRGAGRASYVERNMEMIKKSHFCFVYYDKDRALKTRKSGTRLALQYARKQKKEIVYFP